MPMTTFHQFWIMVAALNPDDRYYALVLWRRGAHASALAVVEARLSSTKEEPTP